MTEQPKSFTERDVWLRAVLASDLPPVAVRVAVRIGLHLHVESGQCNPGIEIIATGSKVSERSVYRQILLLEQAGWIAIIRSGGGYKRSNHYVLKYPDRTVSGFNRENPDRTASGFKTENPDSGDTETLTGVTISTATTVADKKSLSAKRTVVGAKAPTTGEREHSHSLADTPGAPAPDGGALEGLKKHFDALWADWSSHRNFPDTDGDEAAGWKAYVAIVPGEVSPDEIDSRAQAHIAGVKANGLKVGDLWKWLNRNNWRKEPAPLPKPKRGQREPTSGDFIRNRYGGGS